MTDFHYHLARVAKRDFSLEQIMFKWMIEFWWFNETDDACFAATIILRSRRGAIFSLRLVHLLGVIRTVSAR